MPDHTPTSTTAKAAQCRHLFTDGHRCGSKSLRGEPFCFYHQKTRKSFPKAAPQPPHEIAFNLPFPEDRAAIQLSIGEILRRIAANEIDSRRAGLLLYGLQIASSNLPKPNPMSKSRLRDEEQKLDDLELPEEIIEDPDHGPLAPEAEYIPYEPPLSFAGKLLRMCDEEDAEAARKAATLPTLQACQDAGFETVPQPGGVTPSQPNVLRWDKLESNPFIRSTLHTSRGRGSNPSPALQRTFSPTRPSSGPTMHRATQMPSESRMPIPATPQTLPTLTHHFAIPGVLAFREENGLLFADITSPAATGSLCLQGAHLLHWQPTGQQPVLFLSHKSDMAPGKPIRGGIPLLFPWFGPRHDGKEGPAHGFARTQNWQLDFAAQAGEDLHLTLTQGPTELSRSLGFDHFRLAFQITMGRSLALQLTVANEATQPLPYEEGMHTYFHVEDIHEVTIEGLDGTSYIDKKDDFKVKPQIAGPMHITAPTDRVYLDTTTTCTIHDPALKRTITVAKQNSHDTVVWNPWAEMVDIHPDGWHEFVCVETVNVAAQSITLAPGQTHTMHAHITVA